MIDASSERGDQRALAATLRAAGAIVAVSKRGDLLRVDARPIAPQFDDRRLADLAHSPKLTELYLAGTAITPAAVDDLLTLPRLSVLDVQQTELDDAALARLKGLSELTILLVRGSRATAEGVAALRRRMTNVRIVG